MPLLGCIVETILLGFICMKNAHVPCWESEISLAASDYKYSISDIDCCMHMFGCVFYVLLKHMCYVDYVLSLK